MTASLEKLRRHQARLRRCTLCPNVVGPVVTGLPVVSPVYLLGQAPGTRGGAAGRPFAWTAGKTLFRWFASIGLEEAEFRRRVYMAAVCRCFPGKNASGGDRLPASDEVANCSRWLKAELRLLAPDLIIPVGRLAITQLMVIDRLSDVVGSMHRVSLHGIAADAVPLPHPSGASPWHRTEPGRSLLARALCLIQDHPAWRRLCEGA